MRKSVKSILKVVIPLLLGVILVWYSFHRISLSDLSFYFKNIDFIWVILGVILGFLSHFSRAYRWKYMIEPLGYELRISNSIMAVFSGYLINYTIPRAGEISRATIISNYEKIPFEKGMGTILAERVADILVMILIISGALLWKFDIIYDFVYTNLRFNNKMLLLFIALILIVFIFFNVIKNSKHHLFKKLRSLFKGFMEGLLSIFIMKKKWAFLAHTLFIWLMYILMFYFTSFSILQTSELDFFIILIGFIAASFSVAATNGGIGAYPLAVYAAFSIFDIPEAPSLAFGWIMWISHTLLIVVVGGVSLLVLPIYNKFYPKK